MPMSMFLMCKQGSKELNEIVNRTKVITLDKVKIKSCWTNPFDEFFFKALGCLVLILKI